MSVGPLFKPFFKVFFIFPLSKNKSLSLQLSNSGGWLKSSNECHLSVEIFNPRERKIYLVVEKFKLFRELSKFFFKKKLFFFLLKTLSFLWRLFSSFFIFLSAFFFLLFLFCLAFGKSRVYFFGFYFWDLDRLGLAFLIWFLSFFMVSKQVLF